MSIEYNPYSSELMVDPYPVYQKLRDEQPAYYNQELDLWVLSRYADVSAALRSFGGEFTDLGDRINKKLSEASMPR